MDNLIAIDTATLNAIVARCVKDYVRPSFDGLMVYLCNVQQQVYSVMWLAAKATPDDPGSDSSPVVLARVVGDKVVIHVDGVSDFPLSEELIRAGIPREQLLLAHRGEASLIPDHQVNDPLPEDENRAT